jgi:hypothetical protein
VITKFAPAAQDGRSCPGLGAAGVHGLAVPEALWRWSHRRSRHGVRRYIRLSFCGDGADRRHAAGHAWRRASRCSVHTGSRAARMRVRTTTIDRIATTIARDPLSEALRNFAAVGAARDRRPAVDAANAPPR